MSGRLQGRVIPNVEGACVMKDGLNGFRGYMERSMFVRFQTGYLNVISVYFQKIGAKEIHRSLRGHSRRAE
jgi:hypothetical protein